MSLIRSMILGVRPAIRARRLLVGPRRPSWSLELETVAEVLRHGANFSTTLPLAVQRRITDPPRPVTPPMRQVDMVPVDAGGVSAEWFSTPSSATDRVLLYFHGGGYSICSINSHRDYLARTCLESGVRILAPEYRLAPENPFPAQLEDALTVYNWLLDEGYAPDQIVMAGESAGAGLTLSTLISLRDAGERMPAAAALISGWFDLDPNSASMQTNRPYDFVTRRGLRTYARRFTDEAEFRNPLASPIYADFTGLPPLMIQVGAAETLLDDSLRLADLAKEAGVQVELEVWNDMIHGWHLFATFLEDARRAIARVGAFVQSTLEVSPLAAE